MQKNSDDIIIFLLVATSIILLMAGFVITITLLYGKKHIGHQKNIAEIRAEYEKMLLNTQLEIQEQTFQNISREIHDNIGISLTLAKLYLNTLKFDEMGFVREQICASVELLTTAIGDLNAISQSLNAEYIACNGLLSSLKQEVLKLKKLNLHEVVFETLGEPVFMDAQKELIIFRIVQEALNNILKHAQAKKILIQLIYNGSYLYLNVRDDGVGFSLQENKDVTHKSKGVGLSNMNKRAEMINGHLSLVTNRNIGTEIGLKVQY